MTKEQKTGTKEKRKTSLEVLRSIRYSQIFHNSRRFTYSSSSPLRSLKQ